MLPSHRAALRSSLLALLSLASPASLGACAPVDFPQAQSAPAAAPTAAGHSIDLAAMDRSVKPGTDFFLHANGAWDAKAQIPSDRPLTGVAVRVTEEVERRTRGLLEEAASSGAPAGSAAQRIGDYYASYLDEAGIEARGLAPLTPELERIAKIQDARALVAHLGASIRADVDALDSTNFSTGHVLGLWVEQYLNEPSRYAAYLLQGGPGMPDRSYYIDASPRMEALRKAYVLHLATLLQKAGIADAEAKAGRAFALEVKIAAAHVSRADSADVTKGNNPWARGVFAASAPGMDWDAFFAAAGLDRQASFIVWHPGAMKGQLRARGALPVPAQLAQARARRRPGRVDHGAAHRQRREHAGTQRDPLSRGDPLAAVLRSARDGGRQLRRDRLGHRLARGVAKVVKSERAGRDGSKTAWPRLATPAS